MQELPEPLFEALDQQHGKPLRLVDPRTNQAYFLIRADLLERRQEQSDDDLDGINVGMLIAETMRDDDANDPYLDTYQENKGK